MRKTIFSKSGNKPSLVLYGSGGHGKVVADIVRREGRYSAAGFIDDDPRKKGRKVLGLPILGSAGALRRFRRRGILYAIVSIADNRIRREKAALLRAAGFRFATTVHPSAQVAAGVRRGAGSVVMAGAVLNPDARIGEHAIVNTRAVVEHDNVIGNFVHIAPAAALAGGVRVASGAHVGLGARVRQNLRIGAGSAVGAGAVVVKDVPAGATVVGVPAKVLELRKKP